MTQEVNTAEIGHEVDAGVVQESTLETAPADQQPVEVTTRSPDATKDVASVTETPQLPTYIGPTSETVYFTEGELLPWKGRWFSIHLNQESKVIELHLKKLTASQEKRDARRVRWLKQHPDAVSGKSSVRG